MAKKKAMGSFLNFDPSMIDVVIADVQALSQPAQKLVADVVALLGGTKTARRLGTKAAKPAECPSDDGKDCDCGECLQCAYCCQLHALVATSKAMEALAAQSEDGP